MAQPPGSDTRASRQRASRAQHQDGGAHLAHDVVGRLGIGDAPAQRQHAAFIALAVRGDAVLGEQGGHGFDIGEQRHVGQHQPLVGEQAGGHQRQGGVFGAADGDFTVQGAAAADADFIHVGSKEGRLAKP